MKKKTISKVIEKKFDEWLLSITDEHVKELVNKNSIVTGGCIASMLLQEDVKDFDVYFRDKHTAVAVAKYYVKKFKAGNKPKVEEGVHDVDIYVDYEDSPRVKIIVKSAGVAGPSSSENVYKYFEGRPEGEGEEYLENVIAEPGKTDEDKFKVLFLSANAITLTDKIQIVIRFYGEHDDIHGNYDFVHCTNYWDSRERTLHLKQPALEALMAKELVYIGSKFPVCSIIRTRKFIKRGWTINAGQYLKMIFQCSELDLKNVEVLEDQLTGVDVAYFYQLIDIMKDKKDKEPTFVMTQGYLAELIDRIF